MRPAHHPARLVLLTLGTLLSLACGGMEMPSEDPVEIPSAPGRDAPDEGAPDEEAPDDAPDDAPEDDAPEDDAPEEEVPDDAAPASTDCDVGAIVGGEEPLAIAAAPGGETRETIAPGTAIQLDGADADGWVRFESGWDPEEEDRAIAPGWVKAEGLTTEIKHPETYGPDAQPRLYAEAGGEQSKKIRLQPWPPEVTVLGCDGDHLEVRVARGKMVGSGWLISDDHCPNPVTNCL